MNKTAYNKGLIKYAAMSAARFYRKILPYAIGIGGLGIGAGGAVTGIVSGIHNKRIKDSLVLLTDIKNNAQTATNNAVLITEQAKALTDQVKLLPAQAKLLLSLAKDKVNTFDVNTVGKYALGGAGIIGGSILLSNLLSRSKKRRKKDLDLELEA